MTPAEQPHSDCHNGEAACVIDDHPIEETRQTSLPLIDDFEMCRLVLMQDNKRAVCGDACSNCYKYSM